MRRGLIGGLLVILMALSAGPCARAQEVLVYSEFRRIDPFGEIVPQDRGGRPREILSPLVARNSHLTLRVVVEAPAGQHFYLFVGSHPEDVFEIKTYKEMWHDEAGAWVPDRLLPVESPYLSHIPDRYSGLPSQKVESFVMDVYVPEDLRPGRYKLEPQVSVDGRWIIYPMEVRVSDVVVPKHPAPEARLPSARLPADSAAMGPLREFLCGSPEKGGNGYLSIRQLIRRNALEDMAVARAKTAEMSKEVLGSRLLRGLNLDAAAFCSTPKRESEIGPEWYLRGRQFLIKGSREFF